MESTKDKKMMDASSAVSVEKKYRVSTSLLLIVHNEIVNIFVNCQGT